MPYLNPDYLFGRYPDPVQSYPAPKSLHNQSLTNKEVSNEIVFLAYNTHVPFVVHRSLNCTTS